MTKRQKDRDRYRQNRLGIQSGDVIAWRGKGLFAWIVRMFTKSPWTHVGVAVWWGDRLMVLDSYIGKGTRARLLSRHAKGAYWIKSMAAWNQSAEGFALAELGKEYSLQNLWKTWLGLALVKDEYHCAQYVAEVLTRADVPLWQDPPTPESVVREMAYGPVSLGARG